MQVIAFASIILNAALILCCISDGPRGRSSNRRIMGGLDMEAKDAPYTVVVQTDRENATFCGGTLTSVKGIQFVISARHCFYSDRWYTEVWAGDRKNPIKKIVRKIIFPELLDVKIGYDIALLFFNENFVLSEQIGIAELPTKDFMLPVGEKLLVTGDGLDFNDLESWPPRRLRGVFLPVISNEECEQLLQAFSTDGMQVHKEHFFCTYEEGKDLCRDDEGGPAVTTGDGPPILAGVVSYTKGDCAGPNLPKLFTRVAAFTEWIEQQISEEQDFIFDPIDYSY